MLATCPTPDRGGESDERPSRRSSEDAHPRPWTPRTPPASCPCGSTPNSRKRFATAPKRTTRMLVRSFGDARTPRLAQDRLRNLLICRLAPAILTVFSPPMTQPLNARLGAYCTASTGDPWWRARTATSHGRRGHRPMMSRRCAWRGVRPPRSAVSRGPP